VSQSPLDAQGRDGQLQSYRQGWKALNRLLHENKSFSGRERNSAFLNCGADSTRFADVSSAIGWDFADDARAIASVDWDFDGDLDYWVSNRTAPRVRLLENTLENSNHFVSFLLEGNGANTNRDGVGARVELRLGDDEKPRIKTLHAGHSFLSQSSRWLHFGLGGATKIKSITVNWPGGDPETFKVIKADHHYLLKQGNGFVLPFLTPKDIKLQPGSQSVHPPTPLARTIPPSGNILPPLKLGRNTEELKAPTLIQLWSGTCPHCLAKLPKWKKWDRLILLCTDFKSEDQEKARIDFRKAGFTNDPIFCSEEELLSLNAFQASLVDLWIPLPVPSSFLITPTWEVLGIYRGAIEEERVIKDAELALQFDRREAGAPFPGIWIGEVPIGNPMRTSNQLLERGLDQQAISYLQRAVPRLHPKLSRFEKGDSLLTLAQLLGINGRSAEALPVLIKSRAFLPEDSRVGLLLAQAYLDTKDLKGALQANSLALNQHPENLDLLDQRSLILRQLKEWLSAIETDRRITQLSPSSADVKTRIGSTLLFAGKPLEAIQQLKKTLAKHPRELDAANILARVLSCHSNSFVRSPDEALALANRLCQISRNRDNSFLLTKAAALANLEKYNEAKTILNLVKQQKNLSPSLKNLVILINNSLQEKTPFRETRWP
jgi:tetratricopeptide (TPR) repeat protein